MAKDVRFEGAHPVLVTPFDDRENVDLESFARLVSLMAEIGAAGVTVLGVLGESDRVSDTEREALVRTAVAAAAGRIPVVVGTGHRGTRATREMGRAAQSLGADAVTVPPSREPVPSEERIFELFREAADGVAIPLVVQDHPASTEVHMSLPLLLRQVNEIPRVACIKEEAPPAPVRIAALRRGTTARRVPILTGLGALYGLFELEEGSAGFLTGIAFPEVLVAMVRAARDNRVDGARAIYRRFLPLIVFERQPGVAVRKETCRMRGLVASGRVRHPEAGLAPLAAEQRRRVLRHVLPGADIAKPIAVRDPGEGGGP